MNTQTLIVTLIAMQIVNDDALMLINQTLFPETYYVSILWNWNYITLQSFICISDG